MIKEDFLSILLCKTITTYTFQNSLFPFDMVSLGIIKYNYYPKVKPLKENL